MYMCRINRPTPTASRVSRGLFSRNRILPGTKVTTYSGEIKDPRSRPSLSSIDTSYYRSLNQGRVRRVIDGFKEPRVGFGMAQFANDPQGDDKNLTNPSPNCKFELEEKEGKVPQVYLVTIRDVAPGLNFFPSSFPQLRSV